MNQYVALLRGINVGGKNLIRMPDLAAFFERHGFIKVRTYIQSGNVLFAAGEPDKAKLEGLLEEGLSKTFNYEARVVLRSHSEMKEIVSQAPAGFGRERETYRYDVIFIKEGLEPQEAMNSLSYKEGVDQAFAGPGVMYFIRLISRASQSRLTRLTSLPIYQFVTIRNWNTTTRLLAMLEETAQ